MARQSRKHRSNAEFFIMELHQAGDVVKLVKTAIRIMVSELGAKRALVMVDKAAVKFPAASAVYGFQENIWTDDSVPAGLLRVTLDELRPAFQLHGELVDQGFAGSLICVPISRSRDSFRGVLYCDHPQPEGLSQQAAGRMRSLGQEFGNCYRSLTAPAPVRVEKELDIDADYEATRMGFQLAARAIGFVFAVLAIHFFMG